jgi:hypothetical protein
VFVYVYGDIIKMVALGHVIAKKKRLKHPSIHQSGGPLLASTISSQHLLGSLVLAFSQEASIYIIAAY